MIKKDGNLCGQILKAVAILRGKTAIGGVL